MHFARIIVLMSVAVAVSRACTCFPHTVKEDVSRSSFVFRGVVTDVKELPMRAEGGRPRYAVTFAVSEYWKGMPSKEITLHTIEPGTDCIGARFDKGNEYVIFALSQAADDHWLEKYFWYGWLDLMPKGSKILTVNNYCDSTSPVKQAAKTMKQLGKGRKPPA